MSVFYDIARALDANLNAMTSLPPVQWENDTYTPTLDTLYLRATHLPADSLGATVGTAGIDVNLGVYQVDVFAKSNGGKKEALNMADNVANQFKRETQLTYNSRIVRISKVSIGNGTQESGWYQLPVNVYYESYTAQRA